MRDRFIVALKSTATVAKEWWPAHKRAVRRFRDVGLVVLGFVLAAGWDEWKSGREEHKELVRAARSVVQESAIDLDLVGADIAFIDQDSDAADKNMELVRPLDVLLSAAIEVALLRGSFDPKSVDLSIKARKVYSSIVAANHWLEERERYRVSNGAMDNYHRRRKLINAIVKERLSNLKTDLAELSGELRETR
jgi:hypothetical protein